MKTEEMSDEEFEEFIEVLIKGYDKPYEGLGKVLKKFIMEQETLPADMQKILVDNLWDLYEE